MGSSRNLRAALVVSVASLLVAACGNSTGSTPSSTATAGSGGGGGSTGDMWTIGATLPLSGSAAAAGVEFKGGLDIAVNEINAAGGIDGKKIQIDYQDNQLVPAKSVTQFQDLAGKGIKIVISGGSSIISAETPIAKQKGMMIANIAAQSDDVLLNDQVFSFLPTNNMELTTLADLVFTAKKVNKVAVIHSDDAYGASAFKAFSDAYKALGGEVVAEEKHPQGTTSYSTYLIKIRDSQPAGLVVLSNTGEVGPIIAEAAQQNLDVPVFAADPALSASDTKAAGTAMEGVSGVAVRFIADSSPEAAAFAKEFKEKNQVDAFSYAAVPYVAMKLMAKAIGQAKSDDPAKIREFLQNVKDEPSILGPVNAAPGKPVLAFPIFQWTYQGGKVVELKN